MAARTVFAENVLKRLIKLFDSNEYRSIEHFAHSNEIPNSLLSRIINKTSDPRLSSMERIATALEVPLAELLEPASVNGRKKKLSKKKPA